MEELKYRQSGELLLPELNLDELTASRSLGKYGLLRRKYLRERRPVLWTALMLEGRLNEHLLEIEAEANRRLERLIDELAAKAVITEELKAENPLRLPQGVHLPRPAQGILRFELFRYHGFGGQLVY